jgi:putative transposase
MGRSSHLVSSSATPTSQARTSCGADFSQQVVTFSGRAYVAVVEDAWGRYCLGHAVRATKTVQLDLAALEMAIWRRGEMQAAGAIHHTDRGSQGAFNR